jgi:excisionase family DNA binding protein
VNGKIIKANGGDLGLPPKGQALAGDRLLTVEQVADRLQVPPSWIYGRTRSRAADRIPGFRLGKYWRFREADVMNWLETQRS